MEGEGGGGRRSFLIRLQVMSFVVHVDRAGSYACRVLLSRQAFDRAFI